MNERQLHLLGAYFDVGSGELTIYDESAGEFAHTVETSQ